MSLIPFILDLADELNEFSRCLANGVDINDFGFGLYTGTDQQQLQQQQQQQPQASPRRSRTSSFSSFWMPSKRHHPYNRIKSACCVKSGEEAVISAEKSDIGSSSTGCTPGKSASYSVVNKNGFQVSMNVKQFAPNELSVKTIDNCIVVEGRHDDKEDGHGVISRHFVRKYVLPKGYDPNDVLSTLSSDGILTVKAPPPPPPAAKKDECNERIIKIQSTPGPTPVMASSAKDTQAKDTTKKIATSLLSRLEHQFTEKRQKLDSSSEQEDITGANAPKSLATATKNEFHSAPEPVEETEIGSNDVEMEKTEEQITEIVVKQTEKQQKSNFAEIENGVEKKAKNAEQTENLLGKEQLLDEIEKELVTENMADSKNACEKMIECCSAEDETKNIIETSAESKIEENATILNKMDVDEEVETQSADKEIFNSEIVIASVEMTDSETKAVLKVAANTVSAKNINSEPEKKNNADISSSNTLTTTIATNNNNNTTTNTIDSSKTISTTKNLFSEVATENSVDDIKSGNGVVIDEIPAIILNSADCAADTTKISPNNSKDLDDSKAESAADEKVKTETIVLSSGTTTNVIDDVALLKAATADTTSVRENTDGNDILTEPIHGITTAEELNTVTTVESVDCSLFATKAHVENGKNTAATTQIVGTEEMAN